HPLAVAREHPHLGEARDLVEACVGARVRCKDHPRVQRHGNAIGHGENLAMLRVARFYRIATGASVGGTRKDSLMPSPSVEIRSRNCIRYSCRPNLMMSSVRP